MPQQIVKFCVERVDRHVAEVVTLADRYAGAIGVAQPRCGFDHGIEDRLQIERVLREQKNEPAKEICNAILEHAVKQDAYLRQIGEEDRLDDKTVVVIKRL